MQFQNERKLKILLQQRDNVQKQFEEKKVNLWELEGHIKKVKLFSTLAKSIKELKFLVGEGISKATRESVD